MKKIFLILLSACVTLMSMADEVFTDTSKLHIFPNWASTNAGQGNSTSSCTYTFASVFGTELSFDWRVSSEWGYDKLTITLDGTAIVDAVSGEDGNTYTETYTAEGIHTLTFVYSKDGSKNIGEDKASVTNIVVVHPNLRFLYGDMNKDGRLSIGDIAILSDIVLGKREPMYGLSIPLFIQENNLTGTYTIDGHTIRTENGKIVSGESDKESINGHEYVDLGLPSGTLWATCNIGADKPEDYGLYFAWGETTGYTSDTSDGRLFDWANYSFYNSVTKTTKYCMYSSYGIVDEKTELDLEDDAAYVNWGGDWRMPSHAQQQELVNSNYTTTIWTTQNGVYGRLITSNSNGNTLFLPAAGDRRTDSFHGGSSGYYWSRSLDIGYNYVALMLTFNSDGVDTDYSTNRDFGQSVRPIKQP